MLPVTVSISITIKHCNETLSLRNIQNEIINPLICKTEFFCNCENNHHVAAIIISDLVSFPHPRQFLKVLMSFVARFFLFLGITKLD